MTKYKEEEIEFSGYIISVTPRTRRGLLEYRLKIMTPGGESRIAYLREPSIPLKPGIPVKIKAILSRQSEPPRWIIDSIEILRNLKAVEPVPTRVEKITRGAYTIVSGKKEGKMFSIPLQEDELLSKIPKELPQEMYCIFIEHGYQTKLAEVLKKKEYEIFAKTLRFISEIDKENAENEKVVNGYLKSLQIQ